jgi:hypothetical protein
MRESKLPFAAFKPAFGRQKNKNQDHDAQDVPLPGIARISPKEDFLDYVQQIPH